MADTTKHIASLDFDIDKAQKQLDELSKKINSLSSDAENKFKNVASSLKGAFNVSGSTTANLSKAVSAAEKAQQQITVVAEREAQKRATSDNNLQNKMIAAEQKTIEAKKRMAEQVTATEEKELAKMMTSEQKAADKTKTINAKKEADIEKETQKRVTSEQKAADKIKTINAKKEADIEKETQKRVTSEQEVADKIKVIQEKLAADLEKIQAQAALSQQKFEEKQAFQRQKTLDKIALSNLAKNNNFNIGDIVGAAVGINSVTQAFDLLKRAAFGTIQEMEKVDYRMMEISRIMEDGSIDVNAYRDSLIQLSQQYGRSFDDISAATLNFARAGFDAQESLMLTEKAMLALNTAELDSNQATDGLIAVMAQWGYNTGTATEQAENLGAVIDKINKVADNFPITSEDILEALQRTSQGFALTGATIDETIAMIVAAEKEAQRGGKIIGTAMSNMVQQLKTDSKLDLAADLGLNFYEDENLTQFKSVTKIFEEMSNKMMELKQAGKESSVEMQQLLELFTVFRRNIGAGLLSEMSGEDNTYLQALETSMNSLGYSAQENSKYMNTMEAASQQLKATVLDLQNTLGDQGGKSLFAGFILGAENGVNALNTLIKTFGLVPTAIAGVIVAYNLLGKHQIWGNIKEQITNLTELKLKFAAYNTMVKRGATEEKAFEKVQEALNSSQQDYIKSLKGSEASLGGYITQTILANAKTLLLNLGVAALEAGLTFGLNLAIQAVIGLFQEWANSTKNAAESLTSLNDKLNENETSLNDTLTKFQDLRNEMESGNLTTSEYNSKQNELYELQKELINQYGLSASGINLVTGEIEAQTEAIKKLQQAEYRKYLQESESDIQKLSKTLNKTISESFGVDVDASENVKDFLEEIESEIDNFHLDSKLISIVMGSTMGAAADSISGNVKGSAEEVLETYRQIYDRIDQYRKYASEEDAQTLDILAKNISTIISKMEEEYSSSIEEYNTFLQNRLSLDERYNEVYGKILKAKSDLDEASISGNAELVEKSKSDLISAYKEAIDIASKQEGYLKDDMIEIFQDGIDEIQGYAQNNPIKIDVELQKDSVLNKSNQTIFGNIDISREGIHWDTENIEKYSAQLEEMGQNLKEIEGTYSNILGASNAFAIDGGEIEIAYSPLLKTDNGLVPLYQDEVQEYIQEVVNKAQEAVKNGKYSSLSEAILSIDAEGIDDFVNESGDQIKGLIADIGDSAIETGELMHENWVKMFSPEIDNLEGVRLSISDVVNAQRELRDSTEELKVAIEDNNDVVVDTTDVIGEMLTATTEAYTGIENLTSQFEMVYTAMDQFNQNGYITTDMLNNLINNDLLQYFDFLNGTISVNEAAMVNAATAAKISAAAKLQEKAATEIMAIANADAAGTLTTTSATAVSASGGIGELTNSLLQVVAAFQQGTISADEFYKTLQNEGYTGSALSEAALGQISGVMSTLQGQLNALNNLDIRATAYERVQAKSNGGSGGGGSGGSGSRGSSSTKEEKNTILQDFKDVISEREKLEQRWIKKQKELDQLSSSDQKYFLKEEISRYRKYADEVMKLAGVTEEEKLKVRKEYIQKAEDLELDYFKVLEDELKQTKKDIENLYDERIKKVKETAEAQIDALKEVEHVNDRIRDKEEYYRKREELLHGYQGIEYWEQRTGRDAQLALAEARKQLEELDREWQETEQDWDIEDQIESIEKLRDEEVAALQEAMQNEIDEIQAVYDYRVKLFAETGKIIYDDAVLQSRALYNTYKTNFIDPVGTELRNALSQTQQTTPTTKVSDYTIQWGDTLTSIANRFGTTISKIMAANPSITDPNRIYAGRTLKIPSSHTGSRILEDGLVNLQAGEIVLNTKWARDLDRMLAEYSGRGGNETINNGNTVNVRGNMMELNVEVQDKSDINTLARKVKKELESKFSIK